MKTKQVRILSQEMIFRKAIFKIEQATLQHEKYDGTMTPAITRLTLERGDSVAALVHHVQRDELIFTEQFRYPTYAKTGGWLLEIPAGIVGSDETPEEAMKRELEEETGYRVNTIQHIHTFYTSPGGSSERILLYYAQVTDRDHSTNGGGIAMEGEDIRVLSIPTSEVFETLKKGGIMDAKTIIALQWLMQKFQK